MDRDVKIKTERLILRQWHESDFPLFAQLNADQEVMEYFPKPLSKPESDEMGNKIKSLIQENGWGLWAVEIPGVSPFAGFVGLHRPKPNMPCSPCVEVGWRLARPYWGVGYATEAASAALEFGFSHLKLNEIVAFTTCSNLRSQAVMKKLGMRDTKNNFHHPDLDIDHPLREHVLFSITAQDWIEKGR